MPPRARRSRPLARLLSPVLLAALAAVLAVAGLPAVATAQVSARSGPRFSEAATPDLDRRIFDRLVRHLDLDDTQRTIADGLFDEWDAAFRAGLDALRREIRETRPAPRAPTPADRRFEALQEEMRTALREVMERGRARADAAETDEARRAALEAAQEEVRAVRARFDERLRAFGAERSRDPAVDEATETMARLIEGWLPRKRALLESFLNDVEAILDEDQRPRMAEARRIVRRARLLPEGRLPGESIDLVDLVEIAAPRAPGRDEVAGLLTDWSARLDPLIVDRHETLPRLAAEREAARAEDDRRAIERLAAREAGVHARIRDLTTSVLEALLAVLPPEEAELLQTAWRSRVHPGIFRPTAAGRVLGAAVRRTESDPALHAAVRLVRRAHVEEDAPLAEALAEATDAAAEARLRDRLAGTRDETVELRLRELRTRREAAGRRHVDQLKELLPPDTFLTLPGVRAFVDVEREREKSATPEQAGDRARRALIDRFDRDGDGELDAEEREELRRHLRERRERDGG